MWIRTHHFKFRWQSTAFLIKSKFIYVIQIRNFDLKLSQPLKEDELEVKQCSGYEESRPPFTNHEDETHSDSADDILDLPLMNASTLQKSLNLNSTKSPPVKLKNSSFVNVLDDDIDEKKEEIEEEKEGNNYDDCTKMLIESTAMNLEAPFKPLKRCSRARRC